MQLDLYELERKAHVEIRFRGNFFTVATAAIGIGGTIFYAEGIARKSHLDQYSEVGADVATGRALKALRTKICKGSEYPVRHRFMA